MIDIEVKSAYVNTKSGVSAKSGKPYSIREQEAYAHVYGRDCKPAPYPVRVNLSLEDDQPPYQPGLYTLSPVCVYVDRFGSLSLARPKLMPAQPKVRAAA